MSETNIQKPITRFRPCSKVKTSYVVNKINEQFNKRLKGARLGLSKVSREISVQDN